jgi:hypothetical protein
MEVQLTGKFIVHQIRSFNLLHIINKHSTDSKFYDFCFNVRALFGYKNPQSNTIVLIGKGSGGVAEMLQHLKVSNLITKKFILLIHFKYSISSFD